MRTTMMMRFKDSHWLHVLGSMLFIGLGHWLLRHRRRALLYLALTWGPFIFGFSSLLADTVHPLISYSFFVLSFGVYLVHLGSTYKAVHRTAVIQPTGVLKIILLTIFLVMLTSAATIGYVAHAFEVSLVFGNSDCPTICDGDLILSRRVGIRSYHPAVGDIVTFSIADQGHRSVYAKRIAAIHGDTIKDFGIIPDGTFFVLGRNLEQSRDSRHFGVIHVSSIISQPKKVLWPLERTSLIH